MRCLIVASSLMLAACSGSAVTTTEALVATTPTPSPPTTAVTATSSTGTPDAPPLVPQGCGTFDIAELTSLTPVVNPLALIEDTSTSVKLVCNFVGVGDGLDTGVRVEVERVGDKPDGHYTTPGEFESPVEIAGAPGVGSGRGLIRLQLDAEKGMTLEVTIRSLSSSATIPRDGAFLEIRDAVAEFLVLQLAGSSR